MLIRFSLNLWWMAGEYNALNVLILMMNLIEAEGHIKICSYLVPVIT